MKVSPVAPGLVDAFGKAGEARCGTLVAASVTLRSACWMKASTLPRYLLGSRHAILDVAASPWSILVGIILVVSAGLAREYDGEDLIHEPWHALRPLGASLASGTTLFLVVHLAALMKSHKGEGTPPSFFGAWRTFLGLFWCTAPMAWLYAVPYERFMSPVDAIAVNLWTLAIVSVWRVALMTRVIHVVYGFGYVSSFFLVMLFADAVVFAVVTLVPTPVIDVMGGIRHSDRDALIASVTFSVTILSVLTAPVWILGAFISVCVLKPRWPDLAALKTAHVPRGLLVLAGASVVAFIPLLVMSQPEQVNRRDAERLLTSGRVPEAMALMSRRSPDDYPPHWNPPPKMGYRASVPSLEEIRRAMLDEWPADWVARLYIAKIDRGLKNDLMPYWRTASWADIVGQLEEYGDIYEVDPAHAATAQLLLDRAPELRDSDRAALERLSQLSASVGFDDMPERHRAGLLVRAAAGDDVDTVRAILETGLDPDSQSPARRWSTALAAAASTNGVEVIEALLEAGADIEAGSSRHLVSPAHIAAFHGSTDALKALLAHGADPHVGSEDYGSLIYAAAIEGHRDTVQTLLDLNLGIDIQAGRASDRATPLHFAYWHNDSAMVEMLIAAGADPEAQTTDGRLPHEFRRR